MTESELQRKAGRLVDSGVYLNISGLVEALLTSDTAVQATMEDFENLSAPVCSLCCNPAKDEDAEVCKWCGEELEVEYQPQEIYEYWAVASWLAEDLEKAGEPICHDFHGLNVWGRCTTGQAMLLDGVIRELVEKEQRRKWWLNDLTIVPRDEVTS